MMRDNRGMPASDSETMAGTGVSRPRIDLNPEAATKTEDEAGRRVDGVVTSEHLVQFYETDVFLLDMVAEFIGSGLRSGDAAMVIARDAHREGIDVLLQASGLNLATARTCGQYVSIGSAKTLSRFMVGEAPDVDRFMEAVGGIIAQAASKWPGVRVYGDMVALLALEGNYTAAVRLEQLWNDLRKIRTFSLFCAYPIDHFVGKERAELLGNVCREHSSVIPTESYTALSTSDDRLRAVTMLQQKAMWLEAEIAERKRTEERLRVALESERIAHQNTEAALGLRDEFLSIAAHELKTPLTSLSGYTQLLLRDVRRERALEPERLLTGLELITRGVNRLHDLLNQLLDVERLENGKLILDTTRTNLASLMERVVTDVRVYNADRVITFNAPASLDAQVDPIRLEQVLANLLDNAIKYSPDGGPVEVALSGDGELRVEISVRDYGPGVAPDKRQQIFERFYQAHSPDQKSGWGLGLYICRQIVEMHGGEIRAEFPSDGGTCIIVSLPVEPTELNAVP